MSRIEILPDEIINQIAAGEVVERPASALKELIDNAVDAGAKWVHVELQKGGLDEMIVRDDGHGMERADAEMSLRRHATSKIRTFDDLFVIQSMGFRGEALAAISSVSKLTLTTVPRGKEEGTRIINTESGQEVLPWSGPAGTTVAVKSLFYNVPARAKFAKSPAVEFGYCLELVQALSLSHVSVGFSLSHQGKEQFRATPQNPADYQGDLTDETSKCLPTTFGYKGEVALRARAKLVMGKDAGDLLYLTRKSRYGTLEALIAPPGVAKASGKNLHFFVNNRWVKDKLIRQALLRGYHSHLPVGRFPLAVVHLNIDPSVLDVNVHPAKTEIRFQYAGDIQRFITDAVRETLRTGDWAEGVPKSPELGAFWGQSHSNEPSLKFEVSRPSESKPTSELQKPTFAPRDRSLGVEDYKQSYVSRPGASVKVTREVFDLPSPIQSYPSLPLETKVPVNIFGEEDPVSWDQLEYVGTFAKCYLMFRSADSMLFVDQHAFHERILYEKIVNYTDSLTQSQPLLVPEGLDFSPTEIENLMAYHGTLKKLGFDYKKMGTATLEILAVPLMLVGRDLAALFSDLAQKESSHGEKRHLRVSELSHDLIATLACHAAVRSGEELMPGELRQLLKEAQDVDFFHNCPHGRRVFKRWSKQQISKWFDR